MDNLHNSSDPHQPHLDHSDLQNLSHSPETESNNNELKQDSILHTIQNSQECIQKTLANTKPAPRPASTSYGMPVMAGSFRPPVNLARQHAARSLKNDKHLTPKERIEKEDFLGFPPF